MIKQLKLQELNISSFVTDRQKNEIKGGNQGVTASGCGCSLIVCPPTQDKTK